MNDNIEVSVLCAAYNQSDYISTALEGFVNQKTNFSYEVLVHDDASMDGTDKIIKKYEKRYPQLIRGFYESENQYSRGNSIWRLLYPKAKGKYIAICEGDDYWCDSDKLQKQVNIMRNNKNVIACVHNSWKLDCYTNEKTKYCQKSENGILAPEEIIQWDNKAYATASLLLRREWLFVPEAFRMQGVGDYPRAVYMSLQGDIYYLKDCMSVYRYHAKGSWTNKQENDVKKMRFHIKDMNRMLEYVDEYSNGKYHEAIVRKIYSNNFSLVYKEMLNESEKKDYIGLWKNLKTTDKIKLKILIHAKPIAKLYMSLKHKL